MPGVSDWLPTQPASLDAFETRLRRPDLLAATLALELEGALIGDLYLSVGDSGAQLEVAERARDTQADIGWVVGPGHAGTGLASEAGAELLRICFETLGLRRVRAVCYAANAGSWRVMEKIGMRREALHVAESLHRSGEWLDTVSYALLAEEWRSLSDVTTPASTTSHSCADG